MTHQAKTADAHKKWKQIKILHISLILFREFKKPDTEICTNSYFD